MKQVRENLRRSGTKRAGVSSMPIESRLDNVDKWPPCDVLQEITQRGMVTLPDGEEKKLLSNIPVDCSRALYETVLREQPKLVIRDRQ